LALAFGAADILGIVVQAQEQIKLLAALLAFEFVNRHQPIPPNPFVLTLKLAAEIVKVGE
jgi:hypothetical protein